MAVSRASNVTTRLQRVFERVTKEPIILLTIFFALYAAYSHTAFPGEHLVEVFAKKVEGTKHGKDIATWVRNNERRAFGIIIFAPVYFLAPKNQRITLAATAAAWVILVPEHSTWQYVAQAGLLALFFRPELRPDRYIILGAGILLYYLGYLFDDKLFGTTGGAVKSTTPRPSTGTL